MGLVAVTRGRELHTLLATQGPIRVIGNVKGQRNWFYWLARWAEAGEPDMHHARLTAR